MKLQREAGLDKVPGLGVQVEHLVDVPLEQLLTRLITLVVLDQTQDADGLLIHTALPLFR